MIIDNFLPNPAGSDTDGEYITLQNDGTTPQNLSGWKLTDESGKSYSLQGIMNPGERAAFPYNTTKISLNNTGEAVSLFNSSGALIDELSYSGSAAEDKLITHNGVSGGESGVFETWPEPPRVINPSIPSGEIIVFGLMIAVFFAGVFLYAYKKLYGN